MVYLGEMSAFSYTSTRERTCTRASTHKKPAAPHGRKQSARLRQRLRAACPSARLAVCCTSRLVRVSQAACCRATRAHTRNHSNNSKQAGTHVVPFHEFAAPSQTLRHGHGLELQRVNSRLRTSHWLVRSCRRAWKRVSLFLPFLSLILLKAGTRSSPLLLPGCHARTDAAAARFGFGGARRRSGAGSLTH